MSMKIMQSPSSMMVVSLSHRGHRLWVVDRCMDYRYNPSALRITSSYATQANLAALTVDMSKERIKKVLSNVELSVSSYDTAWVAMVPSPNSPNSPCFPKCLNWVMDNQLHDGSWGLHRHHPLLKDSLSSTLASILALKKWNVGEHQINKGLCFIESNFASAMDKNLPSPIGFDIIFAGMLEYAKDLNISLPLNQTDLSVMLHHRELDLRRCCSREKEAYLAYISEGLGNYHDWNMVKKYQMNNGSLFNSPSATAAALIHHQNDACLDYLTSLVNKFGNAGSYAVNATVPTVYPHGLYVRLHVVDTLERLGITRHFKMEIQNVLDESYRYWMQRDEQIFMDVVTGALAFRVLRSNGYEVSSDLLSEITKRGDYMNSLEEPSKDIYAALELHHASQIMHQEELMSFEEQNSSSIDFLKQKSSTSSIRSIHKQVDIALKFPFNGSLERISTRRNIEHYDVDDARILKTTYRYSNISNEDYLRLAVEDYNACQCIYRKELEGLERWVVENRLDKLKFARQKAAYCYFSAASTLSSPELSDARISWAKNSILGVVIDDFFDVGGSMEEWLNLVQCVEKWNINVDDDCCSEEVRIIFLAIKDVVDWVGDKALKQQGRNVTSHLIEILLDMLKSMLREAIWTKDDEVPTINEYMENGYLSFGLGPIVLPILYFVGPRLSEEIVRSSEYHNLFKLMSIEGRLLNDIQGFKRELEAGKLNAVTLHMRYAKSGLEEDKVVKEIKILINNQRRELMRLVLQTKGSIVPKACKDMFWNMSNVLNFFYATDDGFTGNDILDIVKEIIYEPISHKLMF